jgi:hypothetical protein
MNLGEPKASARSQLPTRRAGAGPGKCRTGPEYAGPLHETLDRHSVPVRGVSRAVDREERGRGVTG